MKQTLMVVVDTPHPTQAGKCVTLLRNSLEIDSSCVFDYQKLVDGIKLLYSNKDIIIHLTIL